MSAHGLPSVEYLRQCFKYNPDTGVLVWRDRPRDHFKTDGAWIDFNRKYSGKVTGKIKRIRINKILYVTHRVVWALYYGVITDSWVQHVNGNVLDNRISNLCEVNGNQIIQSESGKFINNKTGWRGVSKQGNRYKAVKRIDGKLKHLGHFDTPEDAHRAYCAAG